MGPAEVQTKDEPAPSLHQRILDDIERNILSGEWPPGYRIPFEYELTEQYSCSRMTVNKALTQLAKAGLIERKRRAGSYVAFPQSQSAVLEIHDIRDEVSAQGLDYGYKLLHRMKRLSGPADARYVELERHSPVIDLVCLHLAGGKPFALEERIINLNAVPEAEAADFTTTPPGPWLISCVPWSNAQHAIRAIAATPEIAAQLDIPKGSPCLAIERNTWNGSFPVTHVRFTYPGNSHALVARFTPSQG